MGKFAGFLKETDLFFNFTQPQLDIVESLCEEMSFREGDLIFSENSHEKELYLILRGQVEIFVNPGLVSSTPAMVIKPEIIATLMRGQSFGEVALVDQGVRSASARSGSRETLLLRISRDRLMAVCDSTPELGYRLMYNLAQDLSQKIRNADLKIREVLLYQTHRTEK